MNDEPKKDLIIYKNIENDSNDNLIYSNIKLINNEIYIQEIHTTNITNNNFIYITAENIKYNFDNWSFKLYLNDSIIETNGDDFDNIINSNLYIFSTSLLSSENNYKIVINEINIVAQSLKEFSISNSYEYVFKIENNIKYDFYSLYPNYTYKFLYNEINNLCISDISYNLIDLKYKLNNEKLNFNNILFENYKQKIILSDVQIYNYINNTKVIFTTIENHNLNATNYIEIIDINNVSNTPFNTTYKINEIINDKQFYIFIDNSYNFYNINNFNNLSIQFYPYITFIENNYDIYFIFNKNYNISFIEIISYIQEFSKISYFHIYGSDNDLSVTQFNIDNKISDHWTFIQTINIDNYTNINDKSYHTIDFNYYKYYKISLFYTEDTNNYSFKFINFYENTNIDISEKLLIFENNDINDISNLHSSLYTSFNLKINVIYLYNIILHPQISTNTEITIQNISTTTNNNGYGLILSIKFNKGNINSITIKEYGYNYDYNDIIYVNKSYFENSSNDLIIQLDSNNFIISQENINKYQNLNSSLWSPEYNNNFDLSLQNLNKTFYINLNEKITPSQISFNGAKNINQFITLFNFYGLIWKTNNYNSKNINYSLDLDNNNSLFTIENFKSESHNSHTTNNFCNSNIISENHYSIQHSNFIHFDINFIHINVDNLLLFDYNISYIQDINLNDEYILSNDIINKLNYKLFLNNIINYDFKIDNISNKLIFKKSDFNLIIINNFLYKLGFSSNNKYYSDSGFSNSNYYLSDFEIPFETIEITDNSNSFKLNTQIITINNSIYTPFQIINELYSRISDSEYEILYFHNKFCIKKQNFTILNSSLNSYLKFNNNIKNLTFIINDTNNSLSYNIGSIDNNFYIKNNYYNINDLILEISNIIVPINIKLIDNAIEIYDTDYFNLVKTNNNILDTLGFYTNSAIFSYINSTLIIIYNGYNYNVNDTIKIIDPNNSNNIILANTTEINNNKYLINFEIINIQGNWTNINENILLYDSNKSNYNIKYINNYYTITSNILSFIYINTKNNKLYIKDNNTNLQANILIIPSNIYTPFQIKNTIQNLLYQFSYDIIFNIENNKFVFINNSNSNFTILTLRYEYSNNILPTLGFNDSINLINYNTKLYSNIFNNYVNNNTYYSDTNINSILDLNIKDNIQTKLGKDFKVKYKNNQYNISKSNFSLHHNNYKGFFDKFSFDTTQIIDDYYLANINNYDCNYFSSINIILEDPIYFNNQNNVILINNLCNIDNLLYYSDTIIKLNNSYEDFSSLKSYINSKLIDFDICLEYLHNDDSLNSQLILKKNNFQIISKSDILPTLGIVQTFDSTTETYNPGEKIVCNSPNLPITNPNIFILLNGELFTDNILQQDNTIINNNIECKVLKWFYDNDTNNRLEIEIISNPNSNTFNFDDNFTNIDNTFNIKFTSQNSQNAITITHLNNKFYYSYITDVYNNTFTTPEAQTINITNYNIQELITELRTINPNLKINLINNKLRFSYELSGISQHFKLYVQNDLSKEIIFNYPINTQNNIYISDTYLESNIKITPNNSQFFINDYYETNGQLILNNSPIIINLYNYLKKYNIYSSETITQIDLSPLEFAKELTNVLNDTLQNTYNVSFNNNKFTIKKEIFKIILYQNNLLNTISFDNRYNNNSFKSNLLTNTTYNINNTNNTLIYYNNITKHILIPYYFDNDLVIQEIYDNNINKTASFKLTIENKVVSNCEIVNSGSNYSINDLIKLNYNNTILDFYVLNVNNGQIIQVSNPNDFQYYKIYNISTFVYTFNKLLNYNYSLTYSNNNFTIRKSNFNIIPTNNSILSTLNFNEISYNNNNIYYSSTYTSNIVKITNNNNILLIQDFYNKQLSGTISVIQDSKIINGFETMFEQQLKYNDFISIDNIIYQIDKINSNTQLEVKDYILTSNVNINYYFIKTYTIVSEIDTFTIDKFIIYFNNLINQNFTDNSFNTNNQKFTFQYINNQFIIQKTNFSIINNNDILPNISLNNTKLSLIDIDNLYYIQSNDLPQYIITTNYTNQLSLTIYPIYVYNLYFTSNTYNINQFQDLCNLIHNKLNTKSIFYNIIYNIFTQKFTISNYKYKFKLIKTPFLQLLGFNIDSQTEYNFSNEFISHNIVSNVININNNNNNLIVQEKKIINYNIYFPINSLTPNIFLDTFINKLKVIDNGFHIQLINNQFKITNNIQFQINFLSNFIINFNNNINNTLKYNFNYLHNNQITIHKYNNKFSYQDTLFSYNTISNNNYSLNEITTTLLQQEQFSKYFYVYSNTDNTNNKYLNIKKLYFNFIFNNPNNVFKLLGYYPNITSQLNYISDSLPLKNTLITQNHSIQLITTTNSNNNFDSLTNKILLFSFQFDITINKNILLQSQNDNTIKYYVTILDIDNLIITISQILPNITYEIYSITNLLTFDDWSNNNIPITKNFQITNNTTKYSSYKFEIISFQSNTDISLYNGSVSNFKVDKYQQIIFTNDNIKYYTGLNSLLQQENYLTTKSLNYDTIDIILNESIIPYKLYIDYINITHFELFAYSNDFDDTQVLLTTNQDINNINNFIIQHQNNYYKSYKFVYYYNDIPQINLIKLYKYQLTDNIVYHQDYIQIDVSLFDKSQYYINSKNNEIISLPIKKTYNQFHYIITNNLNNIFISPQKYNPDTFINYNNNNITILDNYNNYDKLYYYIQTTNINTFFTIPQNQIIYINQDYVYLQYGEFTISQLLIYLNDIFKLYNIQFTYNYITSQLSIYNTQNNIFNLYNKFIINDNFYQAIIIYNNKCIITFKNIHNLNTNDKIYIYSPNISFLNNIFIITYVNQYIIQFDIIQDNKYIIDTDIQIFKYSQSFLHLFNIIPTINNNLLYSYSSQIINDINYNGVVNCIDIGLSDISNIINNVSLHIGNTKIDSHSFKWNDIYNELLNPNQYYYNTMIQSKYLNQSNTYYIPLNFWFNNNYELALPLISLQYHEIFLEIQTNSYFGFNTNIQNDTIEEFNILLDYVFLADDERKLFASSDVEYLITYVNKIENLPINNGYNHIQLNSFDNPVKSLFFYLNNCKLINASVQFNEKLRTEHHNEIYYRIIQKYENNTSKNLKIDYNINNKRQWRKFADDNSQNLYDSYIYSFCLNLKDNINPSGSINFSQFKDSHLILNLKQVQEDSSIDIYAITYNVLVITNGMGGLKYTK